MRPMRTDTQDELRMTPEEGADDPAILDDDGAHEAFSGGNINIWGDRAATSVTQLPDPSSGVKDCILKHADGTCPAVCCECAVFALSLQNAERLRRIYAQFRETE